jgi:MFS family permease
LDIFGTLPSNTKRVVLGASPLAAGLGFYQVAVAVFLPLEGISITNLGVILTTLGLTSVICSIPFAVLSDLYGRKPIMILGALFSAVSILAPGLTANFYWLEASALVGGIADAMFLSTWNAYLADTTDEHVRPAAYSLSFVTFTLSYGIGSFLPGLFPFIPQTLITVHRIVFVALGGLSTLTPLLMFAWAVSTKPQGSRRGILPRKSLGFILKFSATNLMIGLGAGLVIPLIPTWFYLRFNETDVFSGPLLAASSVLMGLAATASPTIAKRTGLVKGIVGTQLLSTVFLLAIPFSPSAFVAAPIYVVRSMLMNMSSPLGDTFLMNLIAEDERATASAFNVVIWRLPNAASTVFGATLLSQGSLNLPFYFCTVLYVTSIALFYALFRRAETKQ